MSKVDELPETPERTAGRQWLVYDRKPTVDDRPRIRSGGYSSNRTPDARDSSIRIENLTAKEVEAFQAFLLGESYLRVVDGRLHAYHAYDSLPEPEDDPIIAAHWKSTGLEKLGNYPREDGWRLPGIVITGLGAGITEREVAHNYWFPSKSKSTDSQIQDALLKNQRRVEECGFVCLRSKRGDDGHYWEQWVLHSLNLARGPLKEFLDEYKASIKVEPHWHAMADRACEFLTSQMGIRYGSMDITIQRWALSCGD